jgi:hypothetical protein
LLGSNVVIEKGAISVDKSLHSVARVFPQGYSGVLTSSLHLAAVEMRADRVLNGTLYNKLIQSVACWTLVPAPVLVENQYRVPAVGVQEITIYTALVSGRAIVGAFLANPLKADRNHRSLFVSVLLQD